jgi:methylmalonyl-CoA mutase
VALPDTDRLGAIIRYLRQENVPGRFPFTAGAWPQRRTDEEPKRQFAGEGGPERTNRRFQFLCRGESSRRLSTAFDSVTLYGEDPQRRPDIHGKIGESGVSVATLDDMRQLFAGFDLADPATSVSMTINGPAPVLLAMFFNTAIDQQLARQVGGAELGSDAAARIRQDTLAALRGTVQADILKEDQAQNTCIFSLEFALRLMGDVQAFLVAHGMRRYYSVSVSGYHIAEAGADPVTQLAFTLANGFTLLEYFLGRGLAVDAVAPSLSFFFSSGLDPEYAVLGRVARRIWAIALRDVYHAAEPSRRLKYHVQTSGRSLHLQDMAFNDIRTTLQAFTALADNCNSLHTNAHDEALTTPTEASVRLAQAIQLVITREFGLYRSENLLQGSHFLQRLSDDVEAAVLAEFIRLDARGGVLRAMETQYQRGRIQEESLRYETRKHSGELPVVGVNTFVQPGPAEAPEAPVVRASPQEKDERLRQVQAFHDRHREQAGPALERLREQVRRGGNVFDTLMETVRVASLGQITAVLYEMGGKYRRSM